MRDKFDEPIDQTDERDVRSADDKTPRRRARPARRLEDTGQYRNGYRVYRDGSYREDFGSDQ